MKADGNNLKTDISSPNHISLLGSPDSKIDEEGQTIRLRPAAADVPMSIGGLAIKLNSKGAYINNAFVTPDAAPVTISGTPVFVDSSNRIHVGGSSYNLPSFSADPPMTSVNGAVALPLPNEVAIDGTTLSAGGSSLTISGAAVFLDSSDNLVLHEPLATQSTTAGQGMGVNGATVHSLSDSNPIAATVFNTGHSPATTTKTPPSLSSDAIAADSTTARASSDGLAGLILGGLGTGAPPSTTLPSPPSTPSGIERSTSTGTRATTGTGSPTKKVLALNLIVGLMTSMLLIVHV
jgi:hypothetical protein